MATTKSVIKDFKLFENKLAEIRSDLHGLNGDLVGAKVKILNYRQSGLYHCQVLSTGEKTTVHLNDLNLLPDEEEKELSGTFSRIKNGKVKPDNFGTNPVIVLQEDQTIYLSSALLLLLGVQVGNKISFAVDNDKTFIFKDEEEDSLVIAENQTVQSFEVYTALSHMMGDLKTTTFSVSISSSSIPDMQGVRFYQISPRVVTSETSYTNNPYAVYEKPVSRTKNVESKTSLLDEISALRGSGFTGFISTINPSPVKGAKKSNKQDKKIDWESLNEGISEIPEVTDFNPTVEL